MKPNKSTFAAAACLALLALSPANLRAATLTVTTTADSGPGSLREALANAADGDTIDASGVIGTIFLTTGELLVTKSVGIIGPGPANLAIDGMTASPYIHRVFHIAPSNTVTMAGLTITNGYTAGISIFNYGGGIYNDHSLLTLSNCTLRGNFAFVGGGVVNDASGSGTARLQLVNCAVSNNRAGDSAGGIYNFGSGASLELINSTVSSNSAYTGGGIWNSGSVEITTSTLTDNRAINGNGGGIFNTGGSLRIVRSTLSGNWAYIYPGGAIYNGNGTVEILNSTLSGHRTEYGAVQQILNYGDYGQARLLILNSTLSMTAPYLGVDGPVNCITFSGNSTVAIGSTILNGYLYGNVFPPQTTFTSLGYNLSSTPNFGGLLNSVGDQTDTDPMLGPLQDNGGPTFTHALLGCSPAIDRGKNFSASSTDQRGAGFARTFSDPGMVDAPGGDSTDVGAFEAQQPIVDTTPPTITCPADIVANATSPAGAAVTFAPTASDNCSLASVTCTPPSDSAFVIGATSVTCVATDGVGLISSCAFTIYVKGAAEQLNDLIAYVQSLPLDTGVKNGLLVKLQDALNGVNANNKPKACSKVQDFINEANAQAAKRKIDEYSANYLIGEAARLRAVLGCK